MEETRQYWTAYHVGHGPIINIVGTEIEVEAILRRYHEKDSNLPEYSIWRSEVRCELNFRNKTAHAPKKKYPVYLAQEFWDYLQIGPFLQSVPTTQEYNRVVPRSFPTSYLTCRSLLIGEPEMRVFVDRKLADLLCPRDTVLREYPETLSHVDLELGLKALRDGRCREQEFHPGIALLQEFFSEVKEASRQKSGMSEDQRGQFKLKWNAMGLRPIP